MGGETEAEKQQSEEKIAHVVRPFGCRSEFTTAQELLLKGSRNRNECRQRILIVLQHSKATPTSTLRCAAPAGYFHCFTAFAVTSEKMAFPPRITTSSTFPSASTVTCKRTTPLIANLRSASGYSGTTFFSGLSCASCEETWRGATRASAAKQRTSAMRADGR